MRGLTARDCLDLSDEGGRLDWISRGLLLAGAAWPDGSPDACAALPVGVRDRLLMALRVRTFGRELGLRFRCRACGADLVARVDLVEMLSAHAAAPPETVSVELGGDVVVARLPTSNDLFATAGLSAEDGGWALWERCLVAPADGDRAALRRRVADAIAEADPLVDVAVEIACDACHARSTETIDIVACFWSEVEAAADGAALEVHALAAAYGWSEDQVLALPPARRARYLALRDR